MKKLMGCLLFVASLSFADGVSKQAQEAADYAVSAYEQKTVDVLAKMVSFKTVAVAGLPFEQNPEFTKFKAYIQSLSGSLGLAFKDHGYVMTVRLGDSANRLGIVTHGDVQPADASKWRKSPFELDSESEPGLLIARGTEDDKGAIATALYAMKAIKDKGIKLNKTIELIIYMAEESDWEPLKAFLTHYKMPDMNVTIDAEYPVVTAENGWSNIAVDINVPKVAFEQAYVTEFHGGSFGSQIPEDAIAVIHNADQSLVKQIQAQSKKHPQVKFSVVLDHTTLTVTAKGKSAHSSKPEEGINAIAYLADVLSFRRWPKSAAGLTVAYMNDLVGTGFTAQKFGQIAYADDFMGPMTMSPTVVKQTEQGININLNLRRPVGKSEQTLKQQTNSALQHWQQQQGITLSNVELYFGEPLVVKNAPHEKVLLDIFAHFTGSKNPQPIAIGGSTNAKLLPNALSFGPSMPGTEYTGHSEHEFISREQMRLNLLMYTAMMVELAQH